MLKRPTSNIERRTLNQHSLAELFRSTFGVRGLGLDARRSTFVPVALVCDAWRRSLLTWGLAALSVIGGPAQAGTAKAVPTYDYLIVVDTSFSMAREKQALSDAIFNLVRGGIAGQARPGDQVGLWTFNEHVYSGRYLPETWTPERGEIIADRIVRYLRSQRFEKRTRLDRAVTEILSAAKASKSLTIFLLSDGDTPIVGTPYDRSLNLLYREHYRELYQARKPFVTTFVAVDGALVAWAVATDGGAVRVPEAPRPFETSHVTAPSVPIVTNAPSLLPSRATPEVIKETLQTNAPVEAPKSAARLSEAKAPPASTPGSPETKPATISATPAPAKALEPTRAPAPNPEGSAPSSNPFSLKQDRTQPAPAAQPAPPSESPLPPLEPAAKAKPLPESRETEIAPETKSAPAPSLIEKSQLNETPQPAFTKPATKASVTNAAQQTAIVPPPSAASSSGKLALLGVTFLVVAVSLLYWSFRSHRSRSRPSIISRSLDREGK